MVEVTVASGMLYPHPSPTKPGSNRLDESLRRILVHRPKKNGRKFSQPRLMLVFDLSWKENWRSSYTRPGPVSWLGASGLLDAAPLVVTIVNSDFEVSPPYI